MRIMQNQNNETITIRCRDCGSDDILQEIAFMANPNTFNGETLGMRDPQWQDYYYCNVCEDECLVSSHTSRGKGGFFGM